VPGSVALRGQNTFPKPCWRVSAAEVMFGTPLNLPGEVLEKTASGGEAEWPEPLPVRPRSNADVVKGPAGQIGEARYLYVWRGPAAGSLAPHYNGHMKWWSGQTRCSSCGSAAAQSLCPRTALSRTWGYVSQSQRARHSGAIGPGRADKGSLLSVQRSLGGGGLV
jgi:hypothetical protein